MSNEEKVTFGKRRPPTELNYDDYKAGNLDGRATEQEEIGRQCSDAEIAARKIVKIRRGAKMISEETATTAVNNAQFSIGQALPTFNAADSKASNTGNQQPVSFLGAGNANPSTDANQRPLFQANGGGLFTNSNNSAPETKSLFANNTANGGSLFSTNTGPSLFGNPKDETLGNNVTTGLNIFNNNPTSGNMFANNNAPSTAETDKPADPKTEEERPGVRLFKNSTGDLFQKPAQEKKDSPVEAPSTGLFSNLAPATGNGLFGGISTSGSLFGNKTENTAVTNTETDKKPSLFGNLGSGEGKLFSGLLSSNTNTTNAGTNIFSGNISNTFLKNKDETVEDPDQEEGGSDEDDQNEKEEVIDKTKALKNYEYEALTEVIHSFEVSNFKANEIPGYGKGKVNIEKIKEGGNELVIFRNPAKLIMFQGLLVKKLTACDYMKGKDDAIFIVSYTMETVEGAKKTTRNNCKMAFNSTDDAKEVLKYIKENY